MYLTKINLDTKNRKTLKALQSLSLFHGAIESSFSGERKRVLWRLDKVGSSYHLLILSEDKPDAEHIASQFSKSKDDWMMKPYGNLLKRVEDKTSWHFRLCANPTYSAFKKGEKRGRVCAHVTKEHQRTWLKEQAEKHGFKVNDNSFEVIDNQWYSFKKGSNRNNVTILSVVYEGVLEVTDAEKFKELLTEGIGREKAYGNGLMTLVNVG